MIGIEAIFALGGLIMIAAGLAGGLESEKLKVSQLPNWVRATAIAAGIILVLLSVYIFPESPFNPASGFRATKIAFESTQTAFFNSSTQTPVIQTRMVTQPPIVVTQPATSSTQAVTNDGNSVSVESLGVTVWDNELEEEEGKSSSDLSILSYQDARGPFYDFQYTMVDDANVELVFSLEESIDLRQYSALQFTLLFKDNKTRCRFVIWGSKDSKLIDLWDGVRLDDSIEVRVTETARGKEQTFTIPIEPILEPIGLSEVSTFEFYSNASLTGESRKDKITVSNINFIR